MLKRIAVFLCVLGVANVASAGLTKGGVFSVKTNTVASHDVGQAGSTEALASVDISGLPTGDAYGTATNVIVTLDLGTGVDTTVTGVGWDVNLEAFSPSWLSEAGVLLLDSTEGLTVSPGAGDDFSGVGAYSSGGIVDFTDNGFLDIVAPGGIISMELGESFDDASVSPDGMWLTPSTFTFEYTAIPEPSSFAILALGFCGLLGLRRK